MKEEQEWATGKLEFSVSGEPMELEITLPVKPTKIRTMLPIFQETTNYFVDLSVDKVKEEGKEISCKAGCGACCRQPVPISEAEAHQLANLVSEMEEPRKSEIIERFEKACELLDEEDWFDQMDETTEMEENERYRKRQLLALNYLAYEIACPFLEEESCSIHQDRPLACREYLVTSPAENCKNPNPADIEKVPLGLKLSSGLLKMTNRNNPNEDINVLPLINSLRWAEKYPEDKEEKTGDVWIAEFFNALLNKDISEEPEK